MTSAYKLSREVCPLLLLLPIFTPIFKTGDEISFSLSISPYIINKDYATFPITSSIPFIITAFAASSIDWSRAAR